MNKPVVVIVGVGLIGGSLGQAWRRAQAAHVIGVARWQSTLDAALAAGAIDEGAIELAAAVARADVVVFCTPVLDIAPTALQAAPAARPGAIFTDVGSTKQHICEILWKQLPDNIVFIGGHPMSGSEKTGVGAADPYLFENAVYCLTPPPQPTEQPIEQAMQVMLKLVQATGAKPLVMAPANHDLVVAAVSHLPHLAAVALVQSIAAAESSSVPMLPLAAGGLRDTTRVAGGPSDVWRDICLTNQQAILRMLDNFQIALQNIYRAVASADKAVLTAEFDSARHVRNSMPTRARGIMGALGEITLMLADQPGAIRDVSALLAQENINIVDIEILRVREGEGGTARLAFSNEATADRAVELLCAHGYTARRR